MSAQHATREAWLSSFVTASRPYFTDAGHPLPETVRVSIGFPSKGARSRTIGECWHAEHSADGAREIFLRPSLQDDASRICDVLTHELCHAALPAGEKHGKTFKRLATTMGLEGKMTATVAGKLCHDLHDHIIEGLGAFPGAKLDDATLAGGKAKQTTRMIKLQCPACDWSCRTTRNHIDTNLHCPTGCGAYLEEAN